MGEEMMCTTACSYLMGYDPTFCFLTHQSSDVVMIYSGQCDKGKILKELGALMLWNCLARASFLMLRFLGKKVTNIHVVLTTDI